LGCANHSERAPANGVLFSPGVGERVFPLVSRRQLKATRFATGFGREPGDVGDRLGSGFRIRKLKIGRPPPQVAPVGEESLDPRFPPLRVGADVASPPAPGAFPWKDGASVRTALSSPMIGAARFS